MRRFLFFIVGFSAFISGSSAVSAQVARYHDSAHKDILQQSAEKGVVLEEFVLRHITSFRRVTEGKQSLSREDVRKIQEEFLEEKRKRQLTHLLSYDLNFDSNVTKSEVSEVVSRNYKGSVQAEQARDRIIDQTMKHDIDGDGILSYQEMANSASRNDIDFIMNPEMKRLQEFYRFDANKDGTVTTEEVNTVARVYFKSIDLNGDTVLSADEAYAAKQGH